LSVSCLTDWQIILLLLICSSTDLLRSPIFYFLRVLSS